MQTSKIQTFALKFLRFIAKMSTELKKLLYIMILLDNNIRTLEKKKIQLPVN